MAETKGDDARVERLGVFCLSLVCVRFRLELDSLHVFFVCVQNIIPHKHSEDRALNDPSVIPGVACERV